MSQNLTTTISNKSKVVEINRDKATVIIGERINPTGRKKVLAALEAGDFDLVKQDAVDQVEAGASVLDVNAGVPDADEVTLLQKVMKTVMEVVDVPLCIDTNNSEALSAALSIYEGKALVNSVNGETKSLDAILPLVKEHQSAVIGLCMDDDGIPPTPDARLKVAGKIIERAGKLGIPVEDIVIDPLTLTLGADSNAGRITLETVARVREEFGVNLTMGASNVSFGLPDRKSINATFLAIAIHAGVTCPITNPLVSEIVRTVWAADLSLGRDEFGMNWIQGYRKRQKQEKSG
jgi:5-methyltetrahydrofolate--homocysteine methyltransferase